MPFKALNSKTVKNNRLHPAVLRESNDIRITPMQANMNAV